MVCKRFYQVARPLLARKLRLDIRLFYTGHGNDHGHDPDQQPRTYSIAEFIHPSFCDTYLHQIQNLSITWDPATSLELSQLPKLRKLELSRTEWYWGEYDEIIVDSVRCAEALHDIAMKGIYDDELKENARGTYCELGNGVQVGDKSVGWVCEILRQPDRRFKMIDNFKARLDCSHSQSQELGIGYAYVSFRYDMGKYSRFSQNYVRTPGEALCISRLNVDVLSISVSRS